MRDAGRIVSEVLDELTQACQHGVTTYELDKLAHSLTLKKKAKPAFKGYLGFPCALCASLNQEVVHGIPSKGRVLKDGDLMKLDYGVVYKGWYGDSARTVPVGTVTPAARELMNLTKAALDAGIAAAQPGARLGDIGAAVQKHVESHGCSVVRDLSGHGIGRALHESPSVFNFGKAGTGMVLKPGMTIAIEPMVNQGTHKVDELDDGWTVVTLDGQLSSHWEHTVAITEEGPQVLTKTGD